MMLLGFGTQSLLVNRVIDRPHLVSLLVMFAVAIILQNLMKVVFSADFRRADTALDGVWTVAGEVTVPVTRFWILVVALAVAGGLTLFLSRSRLGKSIRAAAQNREAARIVRYRRTQGLRGDLRHLHRHHRSGRRAHKLGLAVQPFQGRP